MSFFKSQTVLDITDPTKLCTPYPKPLAHTMLKKQHNQFSFFIARKLQVGLKKGYNLQEKEKGSIFLWAENDKMGQKFR